MEEELISRQPPQSLEAEQAVLGSMLIDSRCVSDVIGILRPEDFFLKQNQQLYETIYTMFNFSQTIDPVTVLDKLRELGYYEENSKDYVLQLMEITPTAANAVRYANIVRDKSMLRDWPRRPATSPKRCTPRWVLRRKCWKVRRRKFTPSGKASVGTAWSISARCCTRSLTV